MVVIGLVDYFNWFDDHSFPLKAVLILCYRDRVVVLDDISKIHANDEELGAVCFDSECLPIRLVFIHECADAVWLGLKIRFVLETFNDVAACMFERKDHHPFPGESVRVLEDCIRAKVRERPDKRRSITVLKVVASVTFDGNWSIDNACDISLVLFFFR